MKYKFICSVERDEGRPARFDGRDYFYSAHFPEMCVESRKLGIAGPDDVRLAGYFLDQLGVPFIRTYVDDSQTDINDEPTGAVVYWA